MSDRRSNVEVVIPTLNEELNLPYALCSVCDWADAVHVVDAESTDCTREIAEEHGARLVVRPWLGYARQKNWALQHLDLRSDWIFILDADEVILPELRDELLAVAARGVDDVAEAAFYVNRYLIFLGRRIRHCDYYPSWNVRFFKQGRARYVVREVHEHMTVDGPTGYLTGHMEHHDRRGLEVYMAKHNRYSTLEAREIVSQLRGETAEVPELEMTGEPVISGDHDRTARASAGLLRSWRRRRWLKQHVYPRLPARWLFRFLYMYVVRLGFLDGATGFRFCLFIAAYDLLVTLKVVEQRVLYKRDRQRAKDSRPSAPLLPKDGSRTHILFMTPLPPPITGQALACQFLLDDLQRSEQVEVTNVMKGHHRQGFTSMGHAFRMLGLLLGLRGRAARAERIYMCPSQSIAGNLKDLLFWTVMGRHREKLYLHLHGGGIRRTVYDRLALLRWCNRRALSRVRGVVVLGDSLRSLFAGMLPEDRVHVVANYADDEFFLPMEQIDQKHAQHGPLRVLFLSNLFPDKGYPEVLAAAAALHVELPGCFCFDFAGGFLEEAQGEQAKRRIAAAGNAEYLGIVSGAAKREALARAHVLCLPSSYPYEGQPLCILEAYASGCAVVTTDQGGIGDIFADGENGPQVKAGDATQVRQALEKLAADRTALGVIGRHNRQEAEKYRGGTFLTAMRSLLLS